MIKKNFIALENHAIVDLNDVFEIVRQDSVNSFTDWPHTIIFKRTTNNESTWKFKKKNYRDCVFIFLTHKLATRYTFSEIEGLDVLKKDDLWKDTEQTEQ